MAEAFDLSKLDEIFHELGQDIGLIPFLQRAQNSYGYLPREVIVGIANRLFMPTSKVYGVATFYTQFHLTPRGRHLVQMCDGTACRVNSSRDIIAQINEVYGIKPGETTEDFKFTFELVYCLGCCAIGPAAIIDGQVVGHLTQRKMINALEKLE
ncbi:NAD(P)H-dependent oxidoreductase subunit E [Candidatus Poribacteria bacterium]|nr:NAD(P)H-dependent oxidoreductase subunit E [Candidatus Poribacteria bacterium]